MCWPTEPPTGAAAAQAFTLHRANCATTFRATDAGTPCWTYAGPGTARFWFQRGAIESTLHRLDVAKALNRNEPDLATERAAEAIIDASEFILPIAPTLVDRNPAAVRIEAVGCKPVTVGSGPVVAEITGTGQSGLQALWGRHNNTVDVTGRTEVAQEWMGLAEVAFASR
ncbi:MAG: hypothetical protein ACI91O_000983 [Candidatus Poriferisodalaceae bacterium]|jgi:hypothetical protein